MIKYIKTCDSLAAEVKQGLSVDLSIIRQTPTTAPPQVGSKELCYLLIKSYTVKSASAPAEQRMDAPAQVQDPPEEETPHAPTTILESLRERLAKYDEEEKKALEAGNSSKARRMGRIKKQYEEAISLHMKGRPIPRADLPDPPGFAPIPVNDPAPASRQAPSPRPAQAPVASSQQPQAASSGATPPRQAAPSPPKKGPSPARQSSVMSVQEKQLQQLEKRQAMFKVEI